MLCHQICIISSYSNFLTNPWNKEKIETLMEQHLVGLILKAEVLKEVVCKSHDLVHPRVVFLHFNTEMTISSQKCAAIYSD